MKEVMRLKDKCINGEVVVLIINCKTDKPQLDNLNNKQGG